MVKKNTKIKIAQIMYGIFVLILEALLLFIYGRRIIEVYGELVGFYILSFYALLFGIILMLLTNIIFGEDNG